MASQQSSLKNASLHQRLLQDIAEFQSKPYPFIQLIPNERDIHEACLILTPNDHIPLHLTVRIPFDFPIRPPSIECDTVITHPNVFGKYICASILNTTEGYTPAYTLKGIAIQILSFFTSENLEQAYGSRVVNLQQYAQRDQKYYNPARQHVCIRCQFGTNGLRGPILTDSNNTGPQLATAVALSSSAVSDPANTTLHFTTNGPITEMPDEILVSLCQFLEDENLVNFSRSWNKIGGAYGLVSRFNIVRKRELNCFVLKKSFQDTQLGVGVKVGHSGKIGNISSEFDLISLEAFHKHHIRTSVQGVDFSHWIPVPLSRRHYNRVQSEVKARLRTIGGLAKIPDGSPANVIYHFMNDVVVKLSNAAAPVAYGVDHRTTLKHASEKAIESYFHLFHMLLCIAASDKSIVTNANAMLHNFLKGQTSKAYCPNLGHLLLAVLIADIDVTQSLLMAIIRETVTRNVVWMLDSRGANLPDLAYLESEAICEHRLAKTFEASKTSYRLLMFFNLFRRAIARGVGPDRKTLATMRDELFDAHGAPPFGAAATLAAQVKDVQEVNDFYSFISVMDVSNTPTEEQLTKFMRDCVAASMRVGYSVWGVSQADAKKLRDGFGADVVVKTFFPGKAGVGGRDGGRGGRGGRGSFRGRG